MNNNEALLVAAIIGALGVGLGALISGWNARRLLVVNRREVLRAERFAAAQTFLKAADVLASEIAAAPTSKRQPGVVDRVAEKVLGDALDLAVRLLVRLLFGFRWERLQDQYLEARARVELLGGPRLAPLLREVDHCLTLETLRSQDGRSEWRILRAKLPTELLREASL